MNRISIVFAASLALAACQSEITNKPAAAVTDTVATQGTTTTTTPANVVTSNVIKEKSSIRFVGAKVTGDHKGQFPAFDGTINYVQGQPTGVSFSMDLNAVETDTADLTTHLK